MIKDDFKGAVIDEVDELPNGDWIVNAWKDGRLIQFNMDNCGDASFNDITDGLTIPDGYKLTIGDMQVSGNEMYKVRQDSIIAPDGTEYMIRACIEKKTMYSWNVFEAVEAMLMKIHIKDNGEKSYIPIDYERDHSFYFQYDADKHDLDGFLETITRRYFNVAGIYKEDIDA